jgi:hypothetical protein
MTARQTGFTVLMSVSGCWKNLEPVSIYFAMARVTANTKLRFYGECTGRRSRGNSIALEPARASRPPRYPGPTVLLARKSLSIEKVLMIQIASFLYPQRIDQ